MKCPKCYSENPETSRFCSNCATRLTRDGQLPDSLTKTQETSVHALGKGTLVGGKYRVVEEIGRGGMGVVYCVHDESLGRDVAIKALPPEFASDPERLRRFEQEARAVAALNHPNILAIHDVGTHEATHYIVTELLEGESLGERLSGGALPVRKAVEMAVQIAQGLSAAHEKGIIHRDLKPENIFITKDGQVKILDFGLARQAAPSNRDDRAGAATITEATQGGTVLGTVGYMSPEQVLGKPLDARSDLFSLGIVLYEMVSGTRPFHKGSAPETMAAILKEEPPDLDETGRGVPLSLGRIIRHCLEKEPSGRFQSARDVAFALESISQATTAGTVPPRAAGGKNRLAVLPFENASADPDMEYLSDGITESLINNLAQLPRLQVLARSTVFRFKGQTDPVEAARQLNVRAVLTGKVVQHRDALIVSVELVDARSGSHLWGERYHRKAADILEVQDAISREISDRLQMRLTSEQKKRLAKRPTGNTEAYQLYLKGRYYWNKWTAEGFRKSIEYYQRAIQIDPNYALSYAGLADIYSSQTVTDAVELSPIELASKAKEAALKALDLDGTLAEAHTSLAEIKFSYEWEWAAAEQEFKRALALNPSSAHAHHRYSHFLIALKRTEESLAASLRALELDPLDAEMGVHLAFHYYHAHQYDEAIETCRSTLEIDPNFHETYWILGLAYEGKKLFEEAITALRKAIDLSEGSAMERFALAHVYHQAGKRAEAEEILKEMKELSQRRHVSGYHSAIVSVGQGKMDQAIEFLEKGYREHSAWMPIISVDPRLDPLRRDPRFQDLLCRMNLPGLK